MKPLDIGIMQGRLSPPIGQRIQAFPEHYWVEEFDYAKAIGFKSIEWTIDAWNWAENPMSNTFGQSLIEEAINRTNVVVQSCTNDAFMQGPWFREDGEAKQEKLKQQFDIIEAAIRFDLRFLVIPLVDEAAPRSSREEAEVVSFLKEVAQHVNSSNLKILFETELVPPKYLTFIENLGDAKVFGVNLDTGNSASLGIDPKEELKLLGSWIKNVHIKDRILDGPTVPLGTGDSRIEDYLRGLHSMQYDGHLIIQGARQPTMDDFFVCKTYYEFCKSIQGCF